MDNNNNGNWLDKAISFISPKAGYKRIAYRNAVRGFDGAMKNHRTNNWRATGTSVNTENYKALKTLRDRSRDLTRNNPYAEKALMVIENNVVGTGIIGQVKSDTKNARNVEIVEKAWKKWVKLANADGDADYYDMQRLAMRAIAQDGEVLIRRRRRRSAAVINPPFQIQLLEADFLDTTKDGDINNKGRIVQGVEYNSTGRRVAYHLYDRHPGEIGGFRGITSNRIPAADIIHLFDEKRPGQVRGYPWSAPVILRMKDFDDYEDAQLVRQKIAACFAAFVHDASGNIPNEATGLPVQGEGDTTPPLIEKFAPGIIEYLPPGKEIKFANPPATQNYGEYGRSMLLGISAGYGVTYESITGDYSNVNFSSGRMGWIEMGRNIKRWQRNIITKKMNEGIWNWFEEAALISGLPADTVSMKWVPPRREMIDPAKETKAMKDSVRSGFTSLSRAQTELGYDPEEIIEEIIESNKKLDDAGIILDTDPRKTAGGGSIQNDTDADEKADNE